MIDIRWACSSQLADLLVLLFSITLYEEKELPASLSRNLWVRRQRAVPLLQSVFWPIYWFHS